MRLLLPAQDAQAAECQGLVFKLALDYFHVP
jgi:hypothetical protein